MNTSIPWITAGWLVIALWGSVCVTSVEVRSPEGDPEDFRFSLNTWREYWIELQDEPEIVQLARRAAEADWRQGNPRWRGGFPGEVDPIYGIPCDGNW